LALGGDNCADAGEDERERSEKLDDEQFRPIAVGQETLSFPHRTVRHSVPQAKNLACRLPPAACQIVWGAKRRRNIVNDALRLAYLN
jgi:hypothetical protein